ncbi:hypothetical protein HK100_009718, partial [Physocladia obscura]
MREQLDRELQEKAQRQANGRQTNLAFAVRNALAAPGLKSIENIASNSGANLN